MDDLWGDDRTNPAAFLVRAWNVATLPVMSPATSASAPTSAPSGSPSPRGTAAPWPSSVPPSSTVGSPGACARRTPGAKTIRTSKNHHDVIDRATSCPGTPQPTNGLGDVVPQSVQPPFPTAPVRCLVLPSAQLRCSAALFSPPAGRTPSCPTTPPAGPVRDGLVARHGSGQAQARSARHGKTCHPRAG